MGRIGRISILSLLLLVSLSSILPGAAAGDGRPRVVIVVLDKIALADLGRPELRNLSWAIRHGGLALMNSRTGGSPGDANHAYLSIGAGSRALATPATGVAYAAGDSLEGGTAAQILERNTGVRAGPDHLVLPDMAAILALAKTDDRPVRPGLLGQAIHEAGLTTCALGNADVPGTQGRQIVAMLMDGRGLIDQGSIGATMTTQDPAWPFGWRTDYDELLTAFDHLTPGSSVVAIETGDMTRLDLYAPYLSPERQDLLRLKALRAADDFLGALLGRLDLSQTLLLLVTPSPPAGAPGGKNSLTPLVVVGPNFGPGLLLSSTTKRPGLVSNLDIAPTVLTHLNLASPREAAGRTVRNAAGAGNLQLLLREEARIVAAESQRQPFLRIYVILLDLVFVAVALFLLWRERRGGIILRAVLLLAAVTPLTLLVSAAHPALGSLACVVGLAAAAVALLLSVRRWPLGSIFILCAATVAGIALDQTLGGPLARYSLLSYSPVTGARYYGLGNEYMGVLLGAAITGTACAYERWHGRRFLPFAAGGIFLGLLAVLGAPGLGTNVGGALAAAIGFAATLLILEGARVSWRKVALVIGLAGGLLILLALIDSLRPSAAQTHLGRLVGSIDQEGAGAFWQLAARKIAMNFKLIRNSSWAPMILFALAGLAAGFLPMGPGREMIRRHRHLTRGLLACLIAATAAFLLNDSGVLAAATLLIYPVMGWSYLALSERR